MADALEKTFSNDSSKHFDEALKIEAKNFVKNFENHYPSEKKQAKLLIWAN